MVGQALIPRRCRVLCYICVSIVSQDYKGLMDQPAEPKFKARPSLYQREPLREAISPELHGLRRALAGRPGADLRAQPAIWRFFCAEHLLVDSHGNEDEEAAEFVAALAAVAADGDDGDDVMMC